MCILTGRKIPRPIRRLSSVNVSSGHCSHTNIVSASHSSLLLVHNICCLGAYCSRLSFVALYLLYLHLFFAFRVMAFTYAKRTTLDEVQYRPKLLSPQHPITWSHAVQWIGLCYTVASLSFGTDEQLKSFHVRTKTYLSRSFLLQNQLDAKFISLRCFDPVVMLLYPLPFCTNSPLRTS